MMDRCPVCHGSQVVRLPWHPAPEATFDPTAVAQPYDTVVTSKDYPCPECAPQRTEGHVAIVEFHSTISTAAHYLALPDYMPAMRRKSAHMIVDRLVEKGFIAFEQRDPDEFEMTAQLRGTLGVVSPAHVASMERRIAERQDEVAREVIAEAAGEIDIWGRDFGRNWLYKSQAHDSLAAALKRVLERRSANASGGA